MQSSVQNVKAGNHSEMVLPAWKRYLNRIVANEVSFAAKYYDRVVQWKKLAFDTGDLLDQIDCEIKEEERSSHSAKSSNLYGSSLFLLVGNLNYSLDFQALLEELKTNLSRSDRVCLVGYNPYLKWLFLVATKLGIRKGEMPLTFVTTSDLKDIARISGFELVRIRPVGFFPFRFFGIGTFINRLF